MKLLYVGKSRFFLLLVLFCTEVYPDTIGLLTSPSQEPYKVFPQIPLLFANRIIGFAWMVAGFELQNSATNLSYESLGQVTGPLLLNSGTMTLVENFITYGEFDWQTGGTIVGDNHAFIFSECESVIPTGNTTFVDTKLYLNNDITIEGTVTLQGDCEIIGNGYAITFGDSGELIIDSSSNLICSYTEFFAVEGNNLRCADDTGVITLENVSINLSDDFTFASGSISFLDVTEISGEYTFDYTSALSSTILENSTLKIAAGLEYKIGKSTDVTVIEPLVFANTSSILNIDNGTLRVKDFGAIFTVGQFVSTNIARLITENVNSAYGLQFGDGVLVDNDFLIKISGGAVLNFESGFLIYNNITDEGIIALSNRADIIRGLTAVLVIKQNLLFKNVTLQLKGGAPTQLLIDPGINISYENVEVVVPIANFLFNGRQDSITSYHFDSSDSVFFDRGILSLNLLIHDGANSLRGSGSLSGKLTFDDAASVLVWSLYGVMSNDIELNGGTLSLASNLNMVSGSITGGGIINLSYYNLMLPPSSPDLTGSITLIGNNGMINLSSDTTISASIVVSGNVIIDCHKNILTLADTAGITIAPNSKLTVKNGYLKNLKNSNISCLASTSSLVFEELTVDLIDDFTFTQGALACKNNVEIRGKENIFTYSSDQNFQIYKESICRMSDLYFTYAPVSEFTNTFLFMGARSILQLRNTTFEAPKGVDFTMGQVLINKRVSFRTDADMSFSYKVTFGDNASSANDCKLVLSGGAICTVEQGALVYANMSSSSISVTDDFSTIAISPSAALALLQPMAFEYGGVRFDDPSTLLLAMSVSLDDFVVVGGDYTLVSL